MKAYIINLEQSKDRYNHMQSVLTNITSIDYEFIAAVDGRKLSDQERNLLFDIPRCTEKYIKAVLPGEIGCTLSHQKCYKKLIDDGLQSVLIFEDDVIIKRKDFDQILTHAEQFVNTDAPRIVLLSGWVWYTRTHSFYESYKLATVFDAFLTQSYIINNSAAKLLLEEKPFIKADDWKYIRKKGIKVSAVVPHIINQDWSGSFTSSIRNKNRIVNGHFMRKIQIYTNIIFLKILKAINHFEPAE